MALAGEIADPGQYNTDVKKLIARARRTTSSSTTTTETGVLQLDGVPVKAGRAYLVFTSPLALDSSAANDESRALIRHTTDGSTAGTSSTVLPGSRVDYRQVDASVPEHRQIMTTYFPSADETLSLLLTASRIAGAGNISILADGTDVIDLCVMDIGSDPGNTGISL